MAWDEKQNKLKGEKIINTEIFREDITLNFNSKYERKAYGYDFLECNPENDKNYIEYMHDGAKELSPLSPAYADGTIVFERSVFCERGSLYTSLLREKYANKVYGNRNYFRLGGVIEFDGEIGYSLFNDFIDAQVFLLNFKKIISSRYGLDNRHLFICGALHQNTIDRHIHFLITSDKDSPINLNSRESNYLEDKEVIINDVVEYINGPSFQGMLIRRHNPKLKNEKEEIITYLNRDLFQFEIGCLSVAKKLIDLEDGEIDNYEDIDVVIRSEIENVAVNLINISQDKKLKDLKFVPDAERILSQIFDSNNETNKKLSDYYFDEYLEGCIEPTFKLIKEGMNHLKGIKFSRSSLSSKRKMNKEYLKTFCDKCKKVANEFSKDYEYKNEMLIHLYEKAVEESRNKEMTKLPFQLQ